MRGRGGRGARERILDTATDLFYRDGINATGVERLAHHASVSKRTLYQHFPNKTAMVEAYLRHIEDGINNPGHTDTDADKVTARERLAALCDTPAAAAGPIRGCPFHNAAVEAAGVIPGIERIVRQHKRNFINTATELARQAGAADPHLLGNQLAVLFEGAAALATSLNDPTPWIHAQDAAHTLIDHAIDPRTGDI